MTKRGRIDKLPPSRFVSRKICVNTLFRIILTMTVALCTPLLKAAEVDVDEVAYQALRPVVAALMNADDAEDLIAREKSLSGATVCKPSLFIWRRFVRIPNKCWRLTRSPRCLLTAAITNWQSAI